MLPVEKLLLAFASELRVNLPSVYWDARIKLLVEEELLLHGPVHELSNEQWTRDPAGVWQASVKKVGVDPATDGAEDNATLDRPVVRLYDF